METKTTLRGLLALLLLALVWAACNDDPTPTPTPNPNPPTPQTPTPSRNPIEDTWRLVAIRYLSEYASETIDTAIYTLTFRPDSTFYGRDVSGRYTLTDSTLHITLADINEAALPQLSRRLRNALRHIERFEIDTAYHSLRIYYAGGRRYLYFSNLPPDPDPDPTPRPERPVTSFLLHHWRLAGFGHTSDGSLTPVAPTGDDRFSLIFLEERTWTGCASVHRLSGTFRTDGPLLTLTFDDEPTTAGESALGRRYIDALRQVQWYRAATEQDSLRLYYSDNDDYLLFIRSDMFMAGPFSEKLFNTWKLIAFGRTADGSQYLPELHSTIPENKSSRFLIQFLSSGEVHITLAFNRGFGRYHANGDRIRITYIGGTEMSETDDGHKYRNALNRSERFKLTADGTRLKIFYNEGRSYLLFRTAPELIGKTPPAALLGRWTLVEQQNGRGRPTIYPPGQHVLTLRADGIAELTGLTFFEQGNTLHYIFHPWNKREYITIGGTEYRYILNADKLWLSNRSESDGGPAYSFRRM